MAEDHATDALLETPLASLHRELGARMVPFAGYNMPVQYPAGIIAEHRHTRAAAGLFDVSHMGQAVLTGPTHEATAAALEALTSGDFLSLRHGRVRYTLLMNATGGIIDDLMVTRSLEPGDDGRLFLVVNAARKAVDAKHIRANLPPEVTYETFDDRALLALQGPEAARVMARHCRAAGELGFMAASSATFDGIDCHISRSGYTGEDGFEISVAADDAEALARALLAEPEVRPIGLGARDTLRLEAGLCLYGHDIDETTSPIEADLGFAVARRRREAGDIPGAERLARELAEGPSRLRVGLKLHGRAPAREGAEVCGGPGHMVGVVTSGGFAPTVAGPVAMAYVPPDLAPLGTHVSAVVRDRPLAAEVVALPFVPHRYYRKP